jgi:hypothetical protein
MFGPLDKPENKVVRDIHGIETWVFGIVVVAALAMGIWPKPILDRSEKSVQAFIAGYSERLQEARKNPDVPSHVFPPLPAAAAGAGVPAPAMVPARGPVKP